MKKPTEFLWILSVAAVGLGWVEGLSSGGRVCADSPPEKGKGESQRLPLPRSKACLCLGRMLLGP